MKYYSTMPPPGIRPRWGHPHTRGLAAAWLFNTEKGWAVNDVARGRTGVLSGANWSWQHRQYGGGIFFGSNDKVTPSMSPVAGTIAGSYFAIVAGIVPNSIVGWHSIIGGQNLFGTNGGKVAYYNSALVGATALVVGTPYVVGITAGIGTSNESRVYLNGQPDCALGTVALGRGPAADWVIGNDAFNEYWNGVISFVYLYLNVLPSAAWHADIAARPFDMFAPVSRTMLTASLFVTGSPVPIFDQYYRRMRSAA